MPERSLVTYTRADLDRHADPLSELGFRPHRKTTETWARREPGPFAVVTREGTMRCPDGWLAIDAHGNPYPIAADEFDRIYEEVQP